MFDNYRLSMLCLDSLQRLSWGRSDSGLCGAGADLQSREGVVGGLCVEGGKGYGSSYWKVTW